jgi:hypothetical protein
MRFCVCVNVVNVLAVLPWARQSDDPHCPRFRPPAQETARRARRPRRQDRSGARGRLSGARLPSRVRHPGAGRQPGGGMITTESRHVEAGGTQADMVGQGFGPSTAGSSKRRYLSRRRRESHVPAWSRPDRCAPGPTFGIRVMLWRPDERAAGDHGFGPRQRTASLTGTAVEIITRRPRFEAEKPTPVRRAAATRSTRS